VGRGHGGRDGVSWPTLTWGGGRGDSLGWFGFVNLGWFGRGRWSGATQFATVHIGPQWSSKALDTRKIFLGLAARLLLILVGGHPVIPNEDALPLGPGFILVDIEQCIDSLAPNLHDTTYPPLPRLVLGHLSHLQLLLGLRHAGHHLDSLMWWLGWSHGY